MRGYYRCDPSVRRVGAKKAVLTSHSLKSVGVRPQPLTNHSSSRDMYMHNYEVSVPMGNVTRRFCDCIAAPKMGY